MGTPCDETSELRKWFKKRAAKKLNDELSREGSEGSEDVKALGSREPIN